MPSLRRAIGLVVVFISFANAAASTCSQSNKCPSDTPCCSAYGQCGVGAYCLGGCDPRSSFSLNSCANRPTCSNDDFNFNTLDGMYSNTVYLGDASKANWVTEGTPVEYQGSSVLLTMAQSTVGTLLSSTHYVWYGKISATMRSSVGKGVVTAFIMMSDVKDEIDFEFVGNDVQAAQSNFYWQGVTNYTNERNLVVENTNTDWHTYEIDWQEDSLTWSVDGQVLRTLNKADTISNTTGRAMYPQTPSRIMISLWPAGLASNGQGTVDWAGGIIDWNSEYMQNGYYYAQLKEVKVECADTPSGVKSSGSKSYGYINDSGMQSSVVLTDEDTVLSSFYATGQNPTLDPEGSTTKKGAQSSAAANANTIPGVVGGGVRGGGDSSLNGGGNGASDPTTGTGAQNEFSQGLDNKATNNKKERAVHGSAFAVLIAFVALIMM